MTTADTEPEAAVDDVERTDDETERDDAHLQDVEPGAGCTEIWEHLSATRDE